jgi:glutamine amidotransferase
MGRLIGYMANRADRLLGALHQERDTIAIGPTDRPDGWGVGFYQGGEVLHKKRRILDGKSVDWQQVANSVRSDCAIIHVRYATVGDFRSENTHPFRMRSWLFAHNGTIERFDAMKAGLIESLPDFIQRSIRGETDSEHFFHVVLSFLHDAGQLDRPNADEGSVLNAIRSAVRLVDRLAKEVGAPPPTLNSLLTDGRTMYGLRRGAPMHFVERQGIHDPIEPESKPPRPTTGQRYVLVEGSVRDVPPPYQSVDEGRILVVNRELSVAQHAL